MQTREIGIELEGVEEFLLEVEYSYSYTPGKYFGLPENCFPEEEESEICLPADLAEKVKRFALDVMVPRWIKQIENEVQNLEFDNKAAEWAAEDKADYENDRAADMYDDMMYERKYGRG